MGGCTAQLHQTFWWQSEPSFGGRLCSIAWDCFSPKYGNQTTRRTDNFILYMPMAPLDAILYIGSTENFTAIFKFALVMISSGIAHDFPNWNHSKYCIARKILAGFFKCRNSSLHSFRTVGSLKKVRDVLVDGNGKAYHHELSPSGQGTMTGLVQRRFRDISSLLPDACHKPVPFDTNHKKQCRALRKKHCQRQNI